jgi:hypothetical protein
VAVPRCTVPSARSSPTIAAVIRKVRISPPSVAVPWGVLPGLPPVHSEARRNFFGVPGNLLG